MGSAAELTALKRRKPDDDDSSNSQAKKPRTRVRYVPLSLVHKPIPQRLASFSCGECHRRKQKVAVISHTAEGCGGLLPNFSSVIARSLALMCDPFRAYNMVTLLNGFSVLLERYPNSVKRIHRERRMKILVRDWQGSNISSNLYYPNIFIVLHRHLLPLPIDTTALIQNSLMKTIVLLPTNRTLAEVLSRVGSGMATVPQEVLLQPPYWSK